MEVSTMPDSLRLYDLAPSPNNMKVRIALTYKNLPFERIPVNPQDRTEVLRVSGQPCAPVLVHGDRVIFDSGSILRYLDANFRRTPSLFSSDAATLGEIEEWEVFVRHDLSKPVRSIFRQFLAAEKDPSEPGRASRLLNDLTGRIEDVLATRKWLVGDVMTAADVSAAPFLFYGMVPPGADAHPIPRFFSERLKLGEKFERTRDWVTRVMSYDRP